MFVSKYQKLWKEIEISRERPNYARNIIKIDYKKFEKLIFEEDDEFVVDTINSIYNGDIFVLTNAFSKNFINELMQKIYIKLHSSEPSFHKMIEGCPNFHRVQDEEIAKKYVFSSIRHSYYWFNWNGDPLQVNEEIKEKWRTIKYLNGLNKYAYENNTPKDGVVDRYQVVRYPSGIGLSELHSDPYQNQRTFISIFMSKKGEDYNKGGFYVLKEGNKKLDVENDINIGDMAIGYATVQHGVDLVDPSKKVDWKSKEGGRWWMGLYSNSSDMVKSRSTGKKSSLKI